MNPTYGVNKNITYEIMNIYYNIIILLIHYNYFTYFLYYIILLNKLYICHMCNQCTVLSTF